MRIWKTISALVITAALAASGITPALAEEKQENNQTSQPPLVLKYNTPAALNQWQEQSLPIGNGAMGASIFGQVADEQIMVNEKTLWTGGPGSANYNYGNCPDAELPTKQANLEKLRSDIATNGSVAPTWDVINSISCPKVGYGNYQSFGKLLLTTPDTDGYSGYERSLDIDNALANVKYVVDGVQYQREALASYPANVIAQHFSANQEGKINFTLRYDTNVSAADQALANAQIAAQGNQITISGSAPDNGLRYAAQIQIVTDGGTVNANSGSLQVTGANSATLLWAGATNYALSYPSYRSTDDPAQRVTTYLEDAAAKSWDELKAEHVADYRELFDRVKLDLSPGPLGYTDQELAAYSAQGSKARALETLYFQYGRYLLIASSRQGSLPANLQGVWNNVNTPPWSADYHVNINLQMNYWPALSTNLEESYGPYLDFVEDLSKAGEVSADKLFNIDQGWVAMNEVNPYGFSGLYNWPTASWFPEAAAWLSQAFYQQYLYSGDLEFLRQRAWPMLKKTSQFYQEFLQTDPRDGTLVITPSYSPEHGNFTAGAAMGQQIVTELFTSTLQAADDLQISDDFTTGLAQTLQKTDNGLRIYDGKVQEWKEPGLVDAAEPTHRHVSQLYALYPGNTISTANTPELAQAAKGTLAERGDGGTGWSKAWKVNFWARLDDGDHAHLMVSQLLKDSTYPNMWDAHPPFQIDGNFGATAGIAEMLVRNDADAINVLPALPKAWAASGSVDGLRAANATTVGVSWVDGEANEIRITADNPQQLSIRSAIASGLVDVSDEEGNKVEASSENGVITFQAQAGEQYRITPGQETTPSEQPTSQASTQPSSSSSQQPSASVSSSQQPSAQPSEQPSASSTANPTSPAASGSVSQPASESSANEKPKVKEVAKPQKLPKTGSVNRDSSRR